MRYSPFAALVGAVGALLFATPTVAQVTLVEPGHVLIQHVDSNPGFPIHPSHVLIETAVPVPTSIESICVDRRNGLVYFQLIDPPLVPASATTHLSRLDPVTNVVTIVQLNTGFGIAENGADMHMDYPLCYGRCAW